MSTEKLSPLDQLMAEWGNGLDTLLPVKSTELKGQDLLIVLLTEMLPRMESVFL